MLSFEFGGVDASRRSKNLLKTSAERDVHIMQRYRQTEVGQARDAVISYAAWDDPLELRKIGIDVERYAVARYPAADAQPDGGDFILDRLVL